MYRFLLTAVRWLKAVFSVLYFLCFVLLLAGCAPVVKTITLYPEITLTAKPLLPKVSAQDMACLSDETFKKLYDRQRLISDYANELELIINSINAEHARREAPRLP